MPETPLGQVVSIRCESDKGRIKHFTVHEHKIRREWREFKSRQYKKHVSQEEWNKGIDQLQQALASMFGKGGV